MGSKEHPQTAHRTVGPVIILASLALCIGLAAGCGRPAGRTGVAAERPESDIKVTAEAYLFDAMVTFEGKKRSVRLELYATDSIVGVGGRSYLGKGAIKGWLTSDTVRLYFPSSNEFVYEPVHDLFASMECSSRQIDLGIIDLFFRRPDSLMTDTSVTVIADSSDADRPAYTLSVPNCPWMLNLVYDERDPGWRLREFSFSNGEDLEITARRREYRDNRNVRLSRFQVSYPPDALRIIP
jgi:hypothetical protein